MAFSLNDGNSDLEFITRKLDPALTTRHDQAQPVINYLAPIIQLLGIPGIPTHSKLAILDCLRGGANTQRWQDFDYLMSEEPKIACTNNGLHDKKNNVGITLS